LRNKIGLRALVLHVAICLVCTLFTIPTSVQAAKKTRANLAKSKKTRKSRSRKRRARSKRRRGKDVKIVKRKPAKPPKKPLFHGKRQEMVASAHPLATEAGLLMLKNGGNAIDAAIAVAFVLGVVEPYSAGLGGGGFLVYYDAKKKKVETLDFRERAPFKAHRRMYMKYGKKGRKLSRRGHLAVGTPGMVSGMEAMARKYASLPWRKLLQPAWKYAYHGYRIHYLMSRHLRWHRYKLARFAHSRKTFYPGGRTLRKGQVLRQRELAWTLSRLQKYGARDFYRGQIARRLVKEMKRGGGLMRAKDLRKYRPYWGKPLVGKYRGHTVYSMGTPSSGGAHLIQMLNILSGYPLHRMPPASSKRLHLITEAMRLAFADRARYQGDARFAKVPIKGIISTAYAAKLRKLISQKRAMKRGSVRPGKPQVFDKKHTTHLSVVDKWGNAVSMTLTINTSFGSGVVARGTGIVLNNEMDDFTTFPGKPNAFGLLQSRANTVQPGKTPLSSMTPTLVFRGKKFCGTLGSPGGPKIITTVTLILMNIVDHNMTPTDAVRFPRIHHQWKPNYLLIERPSPSNRAIYKLRLLGHRIRRRSRWGNAMAIWVGRDDVLRGSADPRGDGIARGL